MSVTITSLKPAKLRRYWPFIARGLDDILRKNTPREYRQLAIGAHTKVRWRPEDIYAAIQFGAATCYLVSRHRRLLGYFVVYPEPIPFSDSTQMVLWTGWALPPRERRAEDDFAGGFIDVLRFIDGLKQKGGHAQLAMITSRTGFMRRSPWREWFAPQFTSYFLTAPQ